MADFRHKPGSGSLFRNTRKENENHPDYKGKICTTCPHCSQEATFDLGAWPKEASGGEKYLRLSAKNEWVKDAQQVPQSQAVPDTFLAPPAATTAPPAAATAPPLATAPDPTPQPQAVPTTKVVDGVTFILQPDGSLIPMSG